MIHRHLNNESTCSNPSTLTKPAIDDIIVSGVREDWQTLGIAIKKYPEIRKITLQICLDRIANEDAMLYHPQRYHLWRNFYWHLQEKSRKYNPMNFLKPEISREDHIQQAIHTLFWDERKNPPPPESPRVIGRILEWGQWCQVMAVEKTFSPEKIAHALENAPYGTVTAPTHNYWSKRLGIPIKPPTRFSKKSWLESTTTAILQNSKNTLSLTISLSEKEEVKLSFFGEYKFPTLEEPLNAENNVKIASIRDILITKLSAVFNREEVKDYLDISEILESSKNPESTLERGLCDLFKRYPQTNLNIIIKTLTWFENFNYSELPQKKRDILEDCCLKITKAEHKLQNAVDNLDENKKPGLPKT